MWFGETTGFFSYPPAETDNRSKVIVLSGEVQYTEFPFGSHQGIRNMNGNAAFRTQETNPDQNWDDQYKHQRMSVFIVVDGHLPDSMRAQVETYFEWCKTEKQLQDYKILALAVLPTEITLGKVSTVVSVARKLRLRRRDLFVAIGSTALTNTVGFAAPTYRRSTPWIFIPTDLVGVLRCPGCDYKVSVDHRTDEGRLHRAKFALSHPPIASFFDLSFLGPLHKHDMKHAKALMIDLAVRTGGELLSHLEAYTDKMSASIQEAPNLLTAIQLAADAKIGAIDKLPHENDLCPTNVDFSDLTAQIINKITDNATDHAYSTALAVSLTCSSLLVKRRLCNADLDRVLSLIRSADLPIYDETLQANGLWKHLMHSAQDQAGASAFISPIALGTKECLKITDFSLDDIGQALSILRNRSPGTFLQPSGSKHISPAVNDCKSKDIMSDSFCEQTAVQNVQYHVVLVPDIFKASNKSLVQDYCVDKIQGRRKKILVVIDDHLAGTVSEIKDYFTKNSSAIEKFRIFPMQVSSKGKDIDSVLRVVNTAIDLGISRRDLLIVVGGGTLMDIVGFAAAMYEGGTPYLRIPTTLVGMIDAGVGAKVGVNFKSSKSLIESYFPPTACLNDPKSFLVKLPRRHFACGLAEAIKMAIVKSPRLFEVIERHHRDVRFTGHSFEMIYLSIRTMLEELEPNLYEHDLRRYPDFGHEFGHIVESRARHKLPHGECVAIGMAISSFIAYLKGRLSQYDLERILNCILDLGLPIYTPEHDCCNADILWTKISTEGVEHKDGMLWLVVPETIGRGGFLDKVSEIDAVLVKQAVLGLRQYAGQYNGETAPTTNGSTETYKSSSSDAPLPETDGEALDDNVPLLSDGEFLLSNGDRHKPTTAAILGASSDIGSQLACHLVRQGMQVLCSLRPTSLNSFMAKTSQVNQQMRIFTGDLLDLANLRLIIQEADVFYNMAGIVTLSSKPEEFAKVIAINGFAQGAITHLIQKMGRERNINVIYPSTQRVHLIRGDATVEAWIKDAAQAYSEIQEALGAEQSMLAALEQFAEQFISSHPLPIGPNVYEVSKRLGEYFVSLLPRRLVARISGAYGPTFSRGFVYRAANPKPEGNIETSEVRDFIYIDDLNEVLGKAAQDQVSDNEAFDAASGKSVDLQEVWHTLRVLIGDRASITFKDKADQDAPKLDPTFARGLLGRDFTSVHLGLRKIFEECSPDSLRPRPIVRLQHPETFGPTESESLAQSTSQLEFECRHDGVCIHAERCPVIDILEQCLNRWFNQLASSHKNVLTERASVPADSYIRLRPASVMSQIGEFTIEKDGENGWLGFIDIHAGLATTVGRPQVLGKMEDVIGRMGHHLLAFLLRDRKPLLSVLEKNRELAVAQRWRKFLKYRGRPYVIALDIGATYLRIGIMGPDGLLLHEPIRVLSPSKLTYPQDTLDVLQERLLDILVYQINTTMASHSNVVFEEVGISFGAVISGDGIVKDASILWDEPARDYDFRNSLLQRLPGLRITIQNDISAAAWRYHDHGRFCLITVSSGLSNKVFNRDLRVLHQLDLDSAEIGGEMGHVVVEPRAVDMAIQHARLQAATHPEKFWQSRLSAYARGNIQDMSARHLGMAAKEGDGFAVRLLEEMNIPYCACGNLADLCSYSSGRAALHYAQRLATRESYGILPNDITDEWLQRAIATSHPLALKVLYDSTYPLALRILQLAADIGLHKVIIVGGFAIRTGRMTYLQTLRDHLVRFYHPSAYFGEWTMRDIRGLVQFGIDDDNDGLIGIGNFVQHLREKYRAVEKVVGEQSLTVITRSIPPCGAQDILVKVVFSGICTTDLQILRGERGHEPIVLGHEGVCQVVQVGREVKGLDVGEMVVLNPNNPLDDFDKLGHTREGLYQEYLKFGKEFVERGQVLSLGRSAVSASDTLVEPLSCVIAAQERIKDRIVGKNVLVIGAGMMGLLFVLMNVKMGARNVFLANRSKENLHFAVARQIIEEGKSFIIGEDFLSQVDEVSAGEGADVIIICMSLGQGVRATQDAITSVNAGGCVYLFAGFRPGDMVVTDGGVKTDAWSIRTGWKTEQIQVASKPVDLSGHRGSRKEDLALAAKIIRDDTFTFGRVISHIISLDLLPSVVQTLVRNGSINGSPAKRVVIDMAAPDNTVNSTEELPLRHLCEAASKQKDAISMGNLFREIGFEDDASLLGWVYPPSWQEIKQTVEMATRMRSLKSKLHFIWVGTGAWVFLVDSLLESTSASQGTTFHTLQSLDPQALADLLARIEDLSLAVCLGVSQSGQTMETVMLMNSLRERFDTAGLDYRDHFAWLTDTCTSARDDKRGEAVIRSLKDHDWRDVDMVPLTFGNRADINALFCAPHSTPMFLSLSILLHDDWKAIQQTYQQYLALRDEAVRQVLPRAYSVASNLVEHIQVSLDESIAPAAKRLVTQLIDQGLGSKQVGYNPRACVASCGEGAGSGHLALQIPVEASKIVKVMLTVNACSIFVAMVAYHRKIDFVTHPKVNLYKRRAKELVAAPAVEQDVSDPGSVSGDILTYLSNNYRTRFVQILCYGHVITTSQQSVKDWLASQLALTAESITIDVISGEEWNHSRYQAAAQVEDTLYVILVPQSYCYQVSGISKRTIHGNTDMLQAIARATYETLLPKTLYFQVGEDFLKDHVSSDAV